MWKILQKLIKVKAGLKNIVGQEKHSYVEGYSYIKYILHTTQQPKIPNWI